MLQLILGRAGSGKTKYVRNILCERLSQGEGDFVLLVPEQFSFESEKQILSSVGAKKMMNIEVISFSRIAEKIIAHTPEALKPRVDDGGRAVLLSMALEAVEDKLSIYKKSKSSYANLKMLLDFIRETKQCGVSAEDIERAGNDTDGSLKEKMSELSLIISAYNALMSEKYFDDFNLLDEAAKALLENGYFKGKTVVLDAFTGFTAQELKIIDVIFKQAKEVLFTLCTDILDENDEYSPFSFIAVTANKILSLAKENGVDKKADIVLKNDSADRFTADLGYMEKNIFSRELTPYSGKSENIVVFKAENKIEECRMTACEIKRLMREENCRCRDIAVFERNTGEYESDLAFMFQKYAVPYFEDQRHSVSTRPLIMLARYALRIADRGLDTDLIISLLKTGMTNVTGDEISILENYSYMWTVKGSQWKNEWTDHPRGFGDKMHNSDTDLLERINAAREKTVKPLVKLIFALKNGSGKQKSQALYNYLFEVEAGEQLKNLALYFEKSGESALSLEQERIWLLLMKVLNSVAEITGESDITAKRYNEIFEIIIAAQSIGTVPQGLDNVTIADAERSRLTEPEYLFVLGLNDGEFPMTQPTSGVITDSERRLLSDNGLEILPPSDKLFAQERFIAYHAITSATKKLYLCYHSNSSDGEASASKIIENAKEIFEDIKEMSSDEPVSIKSVESEQSALTALSASWKNEDDFSSQIKAYFATESKYNGIFNAILRTAEDEKDKTKISDKTIAEKLFGKNMFMSASRVEEYYKCPFMYFCRYGLNVEPLKKAQVDAALSGTIIHYCLEKLLLNFGRGLADMNAGERRVQVKKVLNEFAEEKMNSNKGQNERFLYNFNFHVDIVCRLLDRLIEEFSVSEFTPQYFEMRINEDSPIKPYTLNASDGTTVKLIGSIDRVDLMQKDGKSYVRVIDYKSGSKDFTKENIEFGLNCQMLIYLFALWTNGKETFPNFVPSGVLYFRANDRFVNAERYMSDEQTEKAVNETKKMSGIVLDDPIVLNGMEKGACGIFLPISTSPNSKGKGKMSFDELKHFKNVVDSAIEEMAVSLHNGDAAIYPVNTKNYDKTCEYCDYKSVCGIDDFDKIRENANERSEDRG